MKKTERKDTAIHICLLVIVTLLIVVPILTVFMEAVWDNGSINFSKFISTIMDSNNVETITNSLLLGVCVIVLSTLIATPLAFLLARTRFATKKWLDIVLMIPFMTPPYISSMGWILFMQKRGLFQQMFPWTGNFSEGFFSLFGLTLVMSCHVFPFMMTILKNAILNLGDKLEESAAVCGAGLFYRARKIIFPLLTGNYAIGALLVFVKTLSEYGTPATLGKKFNFNVFTTDIHKFASTSPIDFGKAASLSSVLVGICLVMWFLQNYISSRHTYNIVGGKGAGGGHKKASKRVEVVGLVYILIVILVAIGIPYFSVIVTSLMKLRGYGMRAGNFTLLHYAELFTNNTKGLRAIGTSTVLAVVSATLTSVVGTLIVVFTRRNRKMDQIIRAGSVIPEMIPNIVLVIGLMLFWNKVYQYVPIYNTIWFMILTYSIMFLPYTIQYVSSSLMQIGEGLISAG